VDHPPRHGSRGFLSAVVLRTQPDDQLVALSRAQGAGAFEEIARRHGPALTAFAASVAPASQADDVVQEALIKAHTALLDGAEPEVLTAWLFRIVRNTAIDARRGTRIHDQLDENYDGVEQPPQALERRSEIAALGAAINALPRSQREAIVQREFEGRGHAEIALALGQSPGAVRQLIHRARNSLREAVGGLVPPALVRLATMPGASEVAGGTGLAAAVKLGLAAIVATGTIVAGASIGKGPSPSSAQARPVTSGGADPIARAGGGDSPANDGTGRGRARGPQTGPSPSQGTTGSAQAPVTSTSGSGSGQVGGSGQGDGSGSGAGSGSDSGSGDGSGSDSGSDSGPSSEPGSGGSTEPSDSGGGDTTTTGGDGTSAPPPSDPPTSGAGDGGRI
jgi:RNA polymerase sigma factor (sigma-70 family)